MAEETQLGPNEVKVRHTRNFKDDGTQLAYYNGDESVVDPRTASRLVNEYGSEIVEEGDPEGEAADAPEDPQDDSEK
jgi:hypothetical protein